MNYTLTPAYGRDYKSKAALLADWHAGKDFVINVPPMHAMARWDQKPMGVGDANPGDSITFRYGRLAKVFVHVVPEASSKSVPRPGNYLEDTRDILDSLDRDILDLIGGS